VVGAPHARLRCLATREAYIVFGSARGFPPDLILSELDGAKGFIIQGVQMDDHTGESVHGAGD
jgi:hypothetical protein